MGSLAGCLKHARIAGEEEAHIRRLVKQYRDDGVDGPTANIRAVQDLFRETESERTSVLAQVRERLTPGQTAKVFGKAADQIEGKPKPKRELVAGSLSAAKEDLTAYRDVADNQPYAIREGSDRDRADRQADKAIDDLDRTIDSVSTVRGVRLPAGSSPAQVSGAKEVALGVPRQLASTGFVDLRGLSAATYHDLAAAAEASRSPYLETFVHYAIKDGKIVAVRKVSSRLPDSTQVFVSRKVDEHGVPRQKEFTKEADEMRRWLDRVGATGYAFSHNHPSGDPVPSRADFNVTERLVQELASRYDAAPRQGEEIPLFLGHIVRNGKSYYAIQYNSDGVLEGSAHEFPEGRVFGTETPSPFLGRSISTTEQFADLVRELKRPESYVTVMAASGGKIRGIYDAPVSLFRNIGKATEFLRGLSRMIGAQDFFTYYKGDGSRDSKMVKEVSKGLIVNGSIRDHLYMPDASSSLYQDGVMREPDMRYGKPRMDSQGFRVNQPSKEDPSLSTPPSKGGTINPTTARERLAYELPAMSKMDNVIRKLLDKNIDIVRLVETIMQTKRKVADDLNPVLKEELYMGRVATKNGRFLSDELQPLVNELAAKKVSIDSLDRYLHARHAQEANEHLQSINPDMEDNAALSGMSNQAAQDILDAAPAHMKSLADKIDAMIEKTRKEMVDYGLESQDRVDGWREQYAHYVPLYREGFEQKMGTGQGRSIRGSTVKQRTGSKRGVENILAHIAMDREKTIVRGEKNRTTVALAGLLNKYKNEDIATLAKPVEISYTDPETGLKATAPGDVGPYRVPRISFVNKTTGLVEHRPDPNYQGRDNVVSFRIKGKDYAVIFNEDNDRAMEMAKALKELDVPHLNGFLSAVAPVTRYMAAINTQFNPIFGIVNFIRDSQFAMIALQSTPLKGKQSSIAKYALGMMKGIYQDARAVRNGEHPASEVSQLWERFQNVGGPTGYRDMFKTSADRVNAIRKMMDPDWWQSTTAGKAITAGGILARPESLIVNKVGRPLFNWLSDYNLAMENAMRLSVFKAGIENGLSDEQSASLAKNITVNFNKKGQLSAQAGSLYAFFNANVQGMARLAEVLFEPGKFGVLSALGKKVIAGGVTLGVLQAVGLALSGMGDDEPPEFVKSKNLLIPVPGTDKGYVSIPMPLGLNLLPNLGRMMAEALIYGKPTDKAYKFMALTLDTFSPMGASASVLQTVAPTFVDPAMGLIENKDWTGKRIYREDFSSMKPTPGFQRAKDSATPWARGLAEAINYATLGTAYQPGALSPSPDAIDYLISQATGGVGREASNLAKAATGFYTGEDVPMHTYPLAGRLAGSASGSSAVRDQFYDNLKTLNGEEAEIKGRLKNREDARGYAREHPESRLADVAQKIERQVSDMQKRKRELVRKGASRDAVKLTDQRITALMRSLNQRMEQTQAR